MNKAITWSMLQKEKAKEEVKEKVKETLKVIGYWLGLGLIAIVVVPVIWFLMLVVLV